MPNETAAPVFPERSTALVRALDQAGILAQERIIGAEVGVWNGELSEALLKQIPALELYMIDRWGPSEPDSAERATCQPGVATTSERHFERKKRAILRTGFARARRHILQLESAAAARRIQPGLLDFVFLDAGHDVSSVYQDCRAWYSRIRRRGFLCGHDIDHPDAGPMTEHFSVRLGLELFLSEHAIDVEVQTGADTTWFLRKP